MFGVRRSAERRELEALVSAITASQAVIEFALDGTILTANDSFLSALGYELAEIRGQRHAIFVAPAERETPAYRAFWDDLRRGTFKSGEFKRLGKGGREVWIQATYTPVLDADGTPYKVVKFATDITREKLRNADLAGQIEAIGKSQAVIEFDLDGTVRTANQNFLNALGFRLEEIQGKHHSMFVAPNEREGEVYREFWAKLGRGEYHAGEFKRLGKGGREVWIQATYNPICDSSGRPYKVVKFATDITREKLRNADLAGQIEAIGKSQAVIEFDLDGTIRTANQNFLNALGYRLEEIQGKHHSMFVARAEAESAEYKTLWEALRRGEFQAGEYKRIGKGGKDVWIQATYNPILDASGRPFKVVKFASDVTQQVLTRMRSEHVRQMMEDVAAGAEELNVSVREIADSMSKSKMTAENAFGLVANADESTARLAEAAASMGGIIEAINGITAKINLLALNASIESARAGEAGKGFAVVANEVKTLASQAKEATEEISREIQGMRDISDAVVSGLESIRKAIEDVREYVTSTAAAVEEQSAVANEMSSSMQRASEEAAAIGH
jgi:methyl-accepting chemotaxis protein